MAFNTYNEGLKSASSIANRAIAAEASLSTLALHTAPLPTLLRAFSLYVSAAEAYSHLLASNLVPKPERLAVQKKWRLVLERAEKVKRRVEELGGKVGMAGIDESAEEGAVVRRGGRVNGVVAGEWRQPPGDHEFAVGSTLAPSAPLPTTSTSSSTPPSGSRSPASRSLSLWRDAQQPELAPEQLALDPEWAELPAESWAWTLPEGGWRVRQGPGADCSVTAGLGACLAHNAKWGTSLAQDSLYPQAVSGRPRRSENAKHVVKLLLNGAWRGVVVDSLLPRGKDGRPLHITARPAQPHVTDSTETQTTNGTDALNHHATGPAWLPISVKAYFKALGGYSIPGSNPAPDVYAFTGWIPERLELHSGFRREKEWSRVFEAWQRGQVIVTLGSGRDAPGLVPLHAYGVIDIRDQDGERLLEVFDPGSAKAKRADADADVAELSDAMAAVHLDNDTMTMSWDEVCSRFETLNLNWDPAMLPVTAVRHWSWPKPDQADNDMDESLSLRSSPRYRVTATATRPDAHVWLLLSQHQSAKDVPLDDVALHVFRDFRGGKGTRLAQPAHQETNPYANALHTLVRFPLRQGENVLNAVASRDRGIFQTGFTLRAFASEGTRLEMTRVSLNLPFSETISSALTKRSAGGHPGQATHHMNPQYKLVLGGAGSSKASTLRFGLHGACDLAWNVKLLWGNGERVFELSSESIIASSGPFSYGMAYCEIDDVEAGTYTVLVSSYERDVPGNYTLSVEASSPLTVTQIPQEGAGMYARSVSGQWTTATAGGRPSGGNYAANPRVELVLSQPATLQARLALTVPGPVPVNLTIFKRVASVAGVAEGGTGSGAGDAPGLGEQVATSGPYVERVSGVGLPRTKVPAGVYLAVPSTYQGGVVGGWTMDVWANVAFSAELA